MIKLGERRRGYAYDECDDCRVATEDAKTLGYLENGDGWKIPPGTDRPTWARIISTGRCIRCRAQCTVVRGRPFCRYCYKKIMRRQADCSACNRHFMRPSSDLKRVHCQECWESLPDCPACARGIPVTEQREAHGGRCKTCKRKNNNKKRICMPAEPEPPAKRAEK